MMIGANSPAMSPGFEQQKLDRMDPMQNQQCRVCGEPAAGFHFGAFTCEGCKSFFGRTCNNQSVIQECKNNYRCTVDKKNRTACKACRLRKCLMVGMSKSGSRYGRRSNWFKIHCLMQNQQNPTTTTEHSSLPVHPWPAKSEGSTSDHRDSSFGTNSRTPSPLNTSFDSLRKPSPTSPFKLDPTTLPLSPQKLPSPELPSQFPPTSSLSSLYTSALSNPLLGAFSPFYKLSPLLTHPLLLQLQGQRQHLDLLTEHRQMLAKLGVQQQLQNASTPYSAFLRREEEVEKNEMKEEEDEEEEEEDDRPVSPPHSTDAPMDLSLKISTSSLLLPSTPSSLLLPSSSSSSLLFPSHSPSSSVSSPLSPPMSTSPRIEISMMEDKSHSNQNILSSNALDLTVSS